MNPGGTLITLILTLALLAAPKPSVGQQQAKVFRIGWLSTALAPGETTPQNCPLKGNSIWQAWVESLRERGYVQGRNLVLYCRYTEGRNERAPGLAAELVNLKADLIVAGGTNEVRAVKHASSAIPIVMHSVIEPVRRGLVSNLAHPGGNVTGLTDSAGVEIYGKYLQLLHEAVPTASRIAALRTTRTSSDTETDFAREVDSEMEKEARRLGVAVQFYGIREPEELEHTFSAMTRARAKAVLVTPHAFFAAHAQRIVDLAARNRLPAIYPERQDVYAGGLMGYSVDYIDIFRRVAEYSDRIFKGAKPGDLPVEQPTKFTLILNLKTAKALGLTIPPTLLLQAEEVIR